MTLIAIRSVTNKINLILNSQCQSNAGQPKEAKRFQQLTQQESKGGGRKEASAERLH